VAAVVTTAEIEARCLEGPLANMSSHSLDPFGSAIATEVIRTIRDEGLVERAEKMGSYLMDGLRAVADRYEFLGEVRGRGLMVGLDVLSLEGGNEPDSMMSLALEAEALRSGVVLGYSALSGVVRLLPPLTITREEIDRSLGAVDRAAAHLAEHGIDLMRYLPSHEGSLQLAMSVLRGMMTPPE
jgi:4-aminobutyrate aminotransferase-like enzyme